MICKASNKSVEITSTRVLTTESNVLKMASCLDNTEDMNNDEEISRLSAEIALLNVELNKKRALLKKKQVSNKYKYYIIIH